MSQPHPRLDEVTAFAAGRFRDTVAQLAAYLAIPAISCEPEHAGDVAALAERIRADLAALGMKAAVLHLEGTLPMVAAEYRAGEELPTVLIYGHLDLQPITSPWRTEPHVATEVDGRLYARGSADDMGGWVSHLAAIEAWLAVVGELPCNVKLIIEGEEEIGSPNLERYMDTWPEAFEADCMVLTDCENPSTELPGLTTSLRGLMEVELTVEALGADVHSGLWGGMVPDAGLALMKLISRLTDDNGRLTVLPAEVPESWREAAWAMPLGDDVIRAGAHLVDGVDPLPTEGKPPAEWLWRQPALTVVATTLPTAANKKNALRTSASATLSIRLAPGQTPEQMLAALRPVLEENPPAGVRVSIHSEGGGGAWLYEPKGPAFDAADRAYLKVWGHKLARIGVGGSIPFVAIFGRRYGDLPLILNGVMDPRTTAHGPNESMDLSVFEKAIRSNVVLLDELSRVDFSAGS